MLKEGKVGNAEAISLIVIAICTKAFFTSPSMVVRLVANTGWYMTIISALTAAVGFAFIYALLKRFPRKNLMQINDEVMGKIIGSAFSLMLAGFLIFNAAINMREFTEIIKIFVLTDSPPSFIMGFFIISLIALTLMGLETLARYAKFFVYLLGAGYVLVVLLSIQNFEIHRMFPIFGYGLDKTILNGIVRCSAYGEVILVAIFALSLQGPVQIKKIGFAALFLSGLVISTALLSFNLVFPYQTAQELTSPMFAMAAMVDYGGFLQRLEPIFVFLWIISSFVSVTALFYGALMIYCHIFRIRDKRPIILPMATLIFSIGFIPSGISDVIGGGIQTIRAWGWLIFFLPWPVVLIAAAVRKKKEVE